MDSHSHPSRSSSSHRCIGIFFFLLILLQPVPASAREPDRAAPGQAALATGVVQTPVSRLFCVGPQSSLVVSAPLLAEGWSWRNLFGPVQWAVGSRRRMVQFATIGMCIGLYILMRR